MTYTDAELRQANVDPKTGLATDYLNLFNEAIMLFEMAMDMPDVAEELVACQPRSYIDHFTASGFHGAEIVVWAYEHASPKIRGPFYEACERACDLFQQAIDVLLSSNLEDPAVRFDLETRLSDMKAVVLGLDSHIHGSDAPIIHPAQSEVDALF